MDQWTLSGGSCIINPQGNYVLDPVFGVEKLLIAEIDTTEAIKERMTLDTSGHYQRRDVFTFKVDPERHS